MNPVAAKLKGTFEAVALSRKGMQSHIHFTYQALHEC